MSEGFNIEVTTHFASKSKWVKDIRSHSRDDIKEAWRKGENLVLGTGDNGDETAVDFESVHFLRFQSGEVLDRRTEDVSR